MRLRGTRSRRFYGWPLVVKYTPPPRANLPKSTSGRATSRARLATRLPPTTPIRTPGTNAERLKRHDAERQRSSPRFPPTSTRRREERARRSVSRAPTAPVAGLARRRRSSDREARSPKRTGSANVVAAGRGPGFDRDPHRADAQGHAGSCPRGPRPTRVAYVPGASKAPMGGRGTSSGSAQAQACARCAGRTCDGRPRRGRGAAGERGVARGESGARGELALDVGDLAIGGRGAPRRRTNPAEGGQDLGRDQGDR